jgi:hypothetical protein
VVDWGGKVAAWFGGVTAASAALAGLISGTAEQPLHGLPLVGFIILVVIAAVSFIVLLFTGLSVAWTAWRGRSGGPVFPEVDQADAAAPLAPTGPAVTDRWQPTINGVSSEILLLHNNSMNHPGYTLRSSMGSPPPSVRVGLSIACAQLEAAVSTSDLRAKFLRFLGQPAVMDLVRGLTEIGSGAIWTARDDNPPFNFAAVLSPPLTDDAPVAWARILLPESMTQRYGRDARSAYLVLYVEPRTAAGVPAPPASLASWYQQLSTAVQLSGALAAFLAGDLGLATVSHPAAQMGVWLKAPRHLTELVEVDAFESVPGSVQSNWFMGFAIASTEGGRIADAVVAWLRQMCDSALHLDDYESGLASLRPQPRSSTPRLEVRVCREPEWDTWQSVAYIIALEVEVTNTTDSRIRLAAVGLGSDWDGQPPGELPELSPEQRSALDAEVRAMRRHRYQPELKGLKYIPAQGSVTGWVVTTALRPPLGGAPGLTLRIQEAIGSQYQVVIPRSDPQVVSSSTDGS